MPSPRPSGELSRSRQQQQLRRSSASVMRNSNSANSRGKSSPRVVPNGSKTSSYSSALRASFSSGTGSYHAKENGLYGSREPRPGGNARGMKDNSLTSHSVSSSSAHYQQQQEMSARIAQLEASMSVALGRIISLERDNTEVKLQLEAAEEKEVASMIKVTALEATIEELWRKQDGLRALMTTNSFRSEGATKNRDVDSAQPNQEVMGREGKDTVRISRGSKSLRGRKRSDTGSLFNEEEGKDCDTSVEEQKEGIVDDDAESGNYEDAIVDIAREIKSFRSELTEAAEKHRQEMAPFTVLPTLQERTNGDQDESFGAQNDAEEKAEEEYHCHGVRSTLLNLYFDDDGNFDGLATGGGEHELIARTNGRPPSRGTVHSAAPVPTLFSIPQSMSKETKARERGEEKVVAANPGDLKELESAQCPVGLSSAEALEQTLSSSVTEPTTTPTTAVAVKTTNPIENEGAHGISFGNPSGSSGDRGGDSRRSVEELLLADKNEWPLGAIKF